MLPRGLHIRARSLRGVVILLPLSVILLLIYIYLRKKNTLNNSGEIYSLLIRSGLNETLARFATAQAAHETNNFTSKIFKSNNNAFGMKYAGQVNAQSVKNGYANYVSLNYSVADFVSWYSRHRTNILSLPLFINSLESYVRFLKNNNYFEAPESEYLKGCDHFYNLLFA